MATINTKAQLKEWIKECAEAKDGRWVVVSD